MMELLYSSIFIVFTYFFAGTVLFLITINYISSYKYYKYYKVFYILFLGMGPITISWILEKIMYLFVGFSSKFYILIIFLVFSALFSYIFIFQKIAYKKYLIFIKKFSKIDIFTSLLLLLLLSTNILLPVIGNDSSQYFYVAENIFNEKDFHFYPLIESSSYKGYFPWTHPSGYVGLLTWGYFFSSGLEHLYLLKSISIFYAFLTYLLLSELLKNYGVAYAKIGSLLIFSSPLYCLLISQFHIDTFRIFLFMVPFIFIKIMLELKDNKLTILIGFSLALSAHAHSIGILSIFFGIVIMFLYARKIITIKNILIMGTIIFAILFMRYYQSYQVLGYFIGDKTPIWSLEFIHYNEYLAASRDLDGFMNLLFNGILRGFTRFSSFSYVYWYLLGVTIAIAIVDKKQNKKFFNTLKYLFNADKMFSISFLLLVLWFLATILSTILGGFNFIKNDRYLLTIYPFIIYMSLVLSFKLVAKHKVKNEI